MSYCRPHSPQVLASPNMLPLGIKCHNLCNRNDISSFLLADKCVVRINTDHHFLFSQAVKFIVNLWPVTLMHFSIKDSESGNPWIFQFFILFTQHCRFCIIATGLCNDAINHLFFQMFPYVLPLIMSNSLKSVFEGPWLTEMNRMLNFIGTCQSLFLWQRYSV